MVEKRSRSNVVALPTGSERARRLEFIHHKHVSENAELAVPIKSKIIYSSAALNELKKILGEISLDAHLRLAFPPKVRYSSFEGGAEFYDLKSSPPSGRNVPDSMEEIDSWVKYWYFSAFKKDGELTLRLIDRTNPDSGRARSLEHSIDVKYDLESFLREVSFGRAYF